MAARCRRKSVLLKLVLVFLGLFVLPSCSISFPQDSGNDEATKESFSASPVVGILSQPYYAHNSTKEQYWIPASYVKWLESAGARSIPIPYHATIEEAEELYHQVNGILFPGGGDGPIPAGVQHLWQLAIKDNDFFPIWGTCLGFEYLIQLAATSDETEQNEPLQSGFEAENVSLPLMLWSSSNSGTSNKLSHGSLRGINNKFAAGSTSSRLYSRPRIQRIGTTQPVTMNNHQRGVEPQDFLSNKGLTDRFVSTSVNSDVKGRHFVSTIEPRNPDSLPIYGVQYHPEKNPFEYGTYPHTNTPYQDINHSPDAIQFSLHLARFFVNLTRQSQEQHEYTRPDKFPLINAYPILYTNIPFEQVYVIPNTTRTVDLVKASI